MLKLKNLTKIYTSRPGEYAGGIRNASIELKPGTFFTLLGPSGCGKTTTLRCIAGLEVPDEGQIFIGDTPVFDSSNGASIPLHRRDIGMVFQSYAIWPHMSVFENVSFPMRVSKTKKYTQDEIGTAVHNALESVGLAGYAERSATQLSGGQQQRIALARAIVHRPKLLLLDEPLSNLDATLREDMRTKLKRLQGDLGITAIYVTHDQTEALAMSDTIAVINKGQMEQVGTPREIYFEPKTEFVASFIGHTNILRGRLNGEATPVADGTIIQTVALADGRTLRARVANTVGRDVALSIRPENITLRTSDHPAAADDNTLAGTVTAASFLGNVVQYKITPHHAGEVFHVEGAPSQPMEPGTEVFMSFSAKDTIAVPQSDTTH